MGKNLKLRIYKKCQNCNALFLVIETSKRKFCTHQCALKFRVGNFSNKRKGKSYEEIYGIERAKEIKNKISSFSRGHTVSVETRNKMSKNNVGFLGRKHSLESRKKMSNNNYRKKIFNLRNNKDTNEV